jgi:hypothetical protein
MRRIELLLRMLLVDYRELRKILLLLSLLSLVLRLWEMRTVHQVALDHAGYSIENLRILIDDSHDLRLLMMLQFLRVVKALSEKCEQMINIKY